MSDGLYDPVGANAANGVIISPIGTREEILKAGYNEADTACCGSPGMQSRGCPVWDKCPWTREGFGGYVGTKSTNFKGKGPHLIGVTIQTAKSEGNRIWTTKSTCFGFVRSSLLARMRHGQMEAEEGRDHETIEVTAMEGDKLTQIDREPVDAVGWEKGTNLRTKRVWKETVLEAFPRPTDSDSGKQAGYEQEQRRLAKERAALRESRWAERRQEAATEREAAIVDGDDDIDLDDLAAASAAEKALLAGTVERKGEDEPMRPVAKS